MSEIASTSVCRVKVLVGAKSEGVRLLRDGRLLVSVSAQRKDGHANARVRIMLARHFKVNVTDVHITHGHNQPTKTVHVRLPR